ncbi:MAG: single-stranded DNA-binding protein [Spirochaeta sp.]|nr:single-stranded DNA-binding protein [Spirochaeta sp.]
MTPGEYILHQGDRYSEALATFSPGPPVSAVYNPLVYARTPWARYLRQHATAPRRVVFLGMNPGPWGMAQTGIPFGEVAAVRDWLEIEEPVGQPDRIHPKRPIDGFACTRSEVSGRRLWGLFRERYGTATAFFSENMVINYCPLVFMDAGGRNITPDRLRSAQRRELLEICDRLLADTLAVLQPRYAVGVGRFAAERLRAVTAEKLTAARGRTAAAGYVHPSPVPDASTAPASPPQTVQILHPSPASPAANRGWADVATGQLRDAGVW